MVDKTIPELIDVDLPLGGTEVIHLVDSDGNSRKIALSDLKTFINTDPTVVPSSVPFRGALAYRSSALSIANSTSTNITWNAEDYDTDSIWSAGAPTRLTVPTGVTKVKIISGIVFESATYTLLSLTIIKNGGLTTFADYRGQPLSRNQYTNAVGNTVGLNVVTPVLAVSSGDYFEARCIQTSGGARNIITNSWFSMEVIEATT
jgi:hypothetical protein